MKQSTELIMLNTIKKYASIMPLFKAGYSYSKVMEWSRILEKEGKIDYNELGCRFLTVKGETRLKEIRRNTYEVSILPLKQYKISRLGIDEIFLP